MDWDDRADTSSPPQDNADNSLASVDDADGHDHMSSIYGPPPELRHEPSGE
jgi:hypothetical protein